MKRFLFTIMATLAAVFFFVAEADAQSGAANTAREDARANAENQARAEIESLLARLCPGRCELVEVRATVSEPRSAGAVSPGFEGASNTRFDVEVRRLEATILMDSNLPENFRTNIPRMAQFRLQGIANNIEVRPEFLDFPQPQLPPMPPALPRTTPEPPSFPDPLPQPEQPREEPVVEEAPTEPASAETPVWLEFLPWIALLLTLLILGGLIVLILRRLEAISNKPAEKETKEDSEDSDKSKRPETMPNLEALHADLKRSRAVLNRMLRKWVEDAPEEVAVLVRLIGPEILSDLRKDPEARHTLEIVSDHVGKLHEAIEPEEANSIAEKARSRHAAQLVVDDAGGDAEWDFLEGLSLGQVGKLLTSASQRERGFVLSRLSPVIRSRYLESLNTKERRTLLLEASASESLSRSQARELAGRLRQIADEFIDAGREAAGQASLIVEMIDAMTLNEQEDVLRDLHTNRPDVADAVLGLICLESAILQLPEDTLANAIHHLSLTKMTTFLQGTRRDISDHILSCAPGSKRQAISTELSLDIPSTRADFLEARQAFSGIVMSTLRRDGYEIAKFNANALRRKTHDVSSTSEVAE